MLVCSITFEHLKMGDYALKWLKVVYIGNITTMVSFCPNTYKPKCIELKDNILQFFLILSQHAVDY